MATGPEEFARQLLAMGVQPLTGQAAGHVAFEYDVKGGRFSGKRVALGVAVPPDFPRNPPGGPHVSPKLMPMNPHAPGHPDRTADSPFGSDWQYWSRPYRGKWTGRDAVAAYLAHIDHLFETT